MLSKTSTLRLALILVISLLGAQWGAEAHAYSHLHYSPGHHDAGRHSPAGDPDDSAGRPCGDCAAFAPLLAAAVGPGSLPPVSPLGITPAPRVAVVSLISIVPPLAFRSRGPPSIP